MNINGYVLFLILLYTLPMNINGYVPFLILLYTLPMNINGYVPFLILLYTLPMNVNGYVLFLILLYTLPMNINSGPIPHKYTRYFVRGWKYTISRSHKWQCGANHCYLVLRPSGVISGTPSVVLSSEASLSSFCPDCIALWGVFFLWSFI